VSAKEPSVKKSLFATAASLIVGLTLSASALAVDGEVKKIDADTGKITLKHGEIKSLDLPAMQMAFRVANPAWLKSVQVGDKVNFTADKVGGQFTITSLEVK
jgi:Cu/Ag efflux protein CusF